jgi:xanthine/uracil/vitamin C permease (AzgA family)
MARFCGLRDPATGDFEGSTIAYCVDAFCISMGALMGTSPVSAFIESATGISGKFEFYPSISMSLLTLSSFVQFPRGRENGDNRYCD